MGYELVPRNKKLESFHVKAFSWPKIVSICGYLFPCKISGCNWKFSSREDERMGNEYPKLLTSDGFSITSEESKIIARMIRNYLSIEEHGELRDNYDYYDFLCQFSNWVINSRGFRVR